MNLINTASQVIFNAIAYTTIIVMLLSSMWVLYGGEIYIQLTKDLPVTPAEIQE